MTKSLCPNGMSLWQAKFNVTYGIDVKSPECKHTKEINHRLRNANEFCSLIYDVIFTKCHSHPAIIYSHIIVFSYVRSELRMTLVEHQGFADFPIIETQPTRVSFYKKTNWYLYPTPFSNKRSALSRYSVKSNRIKIP